MPATPDVSSLTADIEKSTVDSFITVALDVMSGDLGPCETIPAALLALEECPNLSLVLVGHSPTISKYLDPLESNHKSRLRISHAEDVVSMDEKPSLALRNKRASSMALALGSVASGESVACVSCGNTGALLALSRFIVKTFPGIDRPAIASRLPTPEGITYMLDLGANVDCSSDHLYQFAIMGSALCRALHQISRPRVALLNVGVEEIKGNEQVRLAAQLVRNNEELNYSGFIEGGELYRGRCEVIVCDGFVGNVALKISEGLAELFQLKMQAHFGTSLRARLALWLGRPFLAKVMDDCSPELYNGASLLGLQGVVVKSHGAAKRDSIRQAIICAYDEGLHQVPQKINTELEGLLI